MSIAIVPLLFLPLWETKVLREIYKRLTQKIFHDIISEDTQLHPQQVYPISPVWGKFFFLTKITVLTAAVYLINDVMRANRYVLKKRVCVSEYI